MAKRIRQVLISRDTKGETVNGKPRAPRVWITGPHFGRDVYSSTESRGKATMFDPDEAERLLAAGHWRNHEPRVEDA